MLQPVKHEASFFHDYGVDDRVSARGASLLDLQNLRAILHRRANVAAWVFAIVVLCALFFVLFVPAKYTATATILSDPRQERVTKTEAVLSGIGADVAAVESQVELLNSTEMIRRVMAKLDLFSDPEFTQGSLLGRALSVFDGKSDAPESEENKAIERFRKKLSVARKGLTYILEVKFSSLDPNKAALIANTISNTYLHDQIKLKTSATEGAGAWLKKRTEELRAQVARSDRAVADFKAEHGLVDLRSDKSGRRLDREQLDQINRELIVARANVAGAQARVDQIRLLADQAGDPEGLAAVQGSPIIQELRKQYAQAAAVEANFAATLGPEHPILKRARSQMARLAGEIQTEVKRVLEAAKNELETAQSKEASLTASLKELTQRLEANDRLSVQLQELQRQAEADSALYQQFLNRAKEVTEQENAQKPDARIVARAVVPTKPSGPGMILLMGLAVIGGALLSLFGAFIAEQLDCSYRTRSQLEQDLGIPCLGLCPVVATGFQGQKLSPLVLLARAAAQVRQLLSHVGMRNVGRATTPDQSASLFFDSIQYLRYETNTARPAQRPLVVLVSSALPNEGKTTISTALADCAGRNGQRTLLIDADSKAGTLSQTMAPGERYGLFDVLRGEVPIEAALVALSDPVAFLPVGQTDENAVNLLSSTQFASLCEASIDFDFVIIDSAPALSSVEAALLQERADFTLLIVEWGKTPREDVMAAQEVLRRGSHRAFGTVLNKIDIGDLYPSSYV
jgi:succinoglycan biosynthesis transport protein ExoP